MFGNNCIQIFHLRRYIIEYNIDPKFLDKYVRANSEDQDQTATREAV